MHVVGHGTYSLLLQNLFGDGTKKTLPHWNIKQFMPFVERVLRSIRLLTNLPSNLHSLRER